MKRYHIISRIAIYMLSVVLIGFGIFHFMYPRDLLVYFPPTFFGDVKWVYAVGAVIVLTGISFLINRFVKIAGYVLFLMLVIFILTVHVPTYMNAGDKEYRQLALINILKDTAIAAFALHIAAGAHHQHFHLEEGD